MRGDRRSGVPSFVAVPPDPAKGNEWRQACLLHCFSGIRNLNLTLLELRHLRYFVAAAEESSLGRAAERLHISAPGLSLQIRDLERETGIELFERSARGIRLTRGGEALLVEARALLSALDAGIARARSVAHGKTGALRIGHVPSALRHSPVANRLIPEFLLRNPDVDVQAIQFTMDEQLAAVREGRLDVAIAYSPPDQDFGLRREMLYDGLSI